MPKEFDPSYVSLYGDGETTDYVFTPKYQLADWGLAHLCQYNSSACLRVSAATHPLLRAPVDGGPFGVDHRGVFSFGMFFYSRIDGEEVIDKNYRNYTDPKRFNTSPLRAVL